MHAFRRNEEALEFYDQAIESDPGFAAAINDKGK